MTTIALSSYSLREQLGPTSFVFTDPAGVERRFGEDAPKLFALGDFPRRAATEARVPAVETVAFQFQGIDDPEIDAFGVALAETGTVLQGVALDDGDLLATDPAARAADVDLLRRWIDRFAAIGTRAVRVNPGSPFNPDHGTTPPAHLVEALGTLGEHAASVGTRLLVENHGGPSSDPEWMTALLDAVGRERLGLLLDLGNFDAITGAIMTEMFGAPDAPSAAEVLATADLSSVYEGIDRLAPRAELVHVKVHAWAPDGTIGFVDLDRAFAILDRHGYAGPLTVEYEGSGPDPWDASRAVLDRVAELTGVDRTVDATR
jgi:sugar phosphate isomerase/epimerase